MPGIAAQLLAFGDELREEGVAVGTAELLDAFAALEEIGWTERETFRETLATTLAKSSNDQRIFNLIFDRFFFRATETQALAHEPGGDSEADGSGGSDGEEQRGSSIDIDQLRDQVQSAIRDGDGGAMGDLARLAIAALSELNESSGVVGVDVQRIRRALGLNQNREPEAEVSGAELGPLPREQVQAFENELRRELQRRSIQRTQKLPPARPLSELDRALPTTTVQSVAQVNRIVAQLRRRLATHGNEQRGKRAHQHVDVRRTMRASLQTGGVPVELKYRPKRPRRPELFVLCDVSTSVSSASVFFLSVLHALHETFRKLRSFVFIERVAEVTEVFHHERDMKKISEQISRQSGVADRSGYTDYGRVWEDFLEMAVDDLGPRSTVIVLGDARTNGRDPRTDLFAQVAAHAGRTVWLNPEPHLYWNYGDSVISQYGEFCQLFECWTIDQLETFVRSLVNV